MTVSQRIVHKTQSCWSTRHFCSCKMQSLGSEPQAFPPCASEEQRDCPLQWHYYISVHPNQLLFQVRFQSAVSFASSSLFYFFLRTPCFCCLYLLNSLCWAITGAGYLNDSGERGWRSEWFLSWLLLILWRGCKGDKTVGKTEALLSQWQNSYWLQ